MAIFSRRTLQRLLAENSGFLSSDQTRQFVAALNKEPADQYLSKEWEVVLLNAFGKAGEIRHEPSFGGSRQADLHFVPRDWPDGAFLADIATVSDIDLERRNPIQALQEELLRLVKKRRLRADSFSCRVGGNYGQDFLDERKRLKLPDKRDLKSRIFETNEFKSWLDEIERQPELPSSIAFNSEDTAVAFEYDSAQRYFNSSFPTYRSIAHREPDARDENLVPHLRNLSRNSLYGALENKTDQLKGTSYEGTLGIIICDGGCHLMRERFGQGQGSARQVISKFLLESTSISFVVTVAVEYDSQFGNSRKPYVEWNAYFRPNINKDFCRMLTARLEAVFAGMPVPQTDAFNAINWLRSEHRRVGRSFIGRCEMTDNGRRITLSARALLELLAGKIDQQRFLEAHGFAASEHSDSDGNPFEWNFKTGSLIRSTSIKSSPDEDDDLITFEFGPPDPAASPFQTPE